MIVPINKIRMKKILATLSILVFLANCAPQKTCPTYLKNTKKVAPSTAKV